MTLPAKNGFTLLEIIITISITSILFVLAIPSYRGFQANQELIQAKDNLKSDLRFAQSQALAGIKAPSCGAATKLVGWYIRRIAVNSYGIYARCVGQSSLIKQVNLPTGTTVSIPGNIHILFRPTDVGTQDVLFGNAEVDPPIPAPGVSEATMTLTKGSASKIIRVRATGDIYE